MAVYDGLVGKSSLTRRQFELLMNYLPVTSGEASLKDAAAASSSGRTKGQAGPLTIGSYSRTLSQARSNVKQSIVTVFLGVRLGVVKIEDVRRLFELAALGGGPLPEAESERLAVVLEALLNRMVL